MCDKSVNGGESAAAPCTSCALEYVQLRWLGLNSLAEGSTLARFIPSSWSIAHATAAPSGFAAPQGAVRLDRRVLSNAPWGPLASPVWV